MNINKDRPIAFIGEPGPEQNKVFAEYEGGKRKPLKNMTNPRFQVVFSWGKDGESDVAFSIIHALFGSMKAARNLYTGIHWHLLKDIPANKSWRIETTEIIETLTAHGYIGHSPAHEAIKHFQQHRMKGITPSNIRYDQSRRIMLHACIQCGLKFDDSDLSDLKLGADEQDYALAVKYGHLTACKAIEHVKQRSPYIWEGNRICVGADFTWKGMGVRCTSFAQDGQSLIACTYRYDEKEGRHIIDRRIRITYQEMAEAEKTRTTNNRVGTAIVWVFRYLNLLAEGNTESYAHYCA